MNKLWFVEFIKASSIRRSREFFIQENYVDSNVRKKDTSLLIIVIGN